MWKENKDNTSYYALFLKNAVTVNIGYSAFMIQTQLPYGINRS